MNGLIDNIREEIKEEFTLSTNETELIITTNNLWIADKIVELLMFNHISFNVDVYHNYIIEYDITISKYYEVLFKDKNLLSLKYKAKPKVEPKVEPKDL